MVIILVRITYFFKSSASKINALNTTGGFFCCFFGFFFLSCKPSREKCGYYSALISLHSVNFEGDNLFVLQVPDTVHREYFSPV